MPCTSLTYRLFFAYNEIKLCVFSFCLRNIIRLTSFVEQTPRWGKTQSRQQRLGVSGIAAVIYIRLIHSARKKQAAKKGEGEQQPAKQQHQQQGKKKHSKKHGIGQARPPPPPKRYIPPPKPPRPAPDPLEAWGLASVLPADLVVILKKFSKKDATTKIRAVEDLQNWVADIDNREGGRESLVVALPVWVCSSYLECVELTTHSFTTSLQCSSHRIED